MAAVATRLQEIMTNPINAMLTLQSEQYSINLSIAALFNGVISTDLGQWPTN
jgi:hypothetical protein